MADESSKNSTGAKAWLERQRLYSAQMSERRLVELRRMSASERFLEFLALWEFGNKADVSSSNSATIGPTEIDLARWERRKRVSAMIAKAELQTKNSAIKG